MIRNCYISLIAVCLLFQNSQIQVFSVNEIVTNHINALGDLNKLKSVQTMRLSGEYYTNGAELPLTILKKRPNLYRLEISVGEKKIIQGYNGKVAWTINELQSQEANEIQDQRTISCLKL